jgi:hypothetical protein
VLPLPPTAPSPVSRTCLDAAVDQYGRALKEDAAVVAHADRVLQKEDGESTTPSSAEFEIELLSANNSVKTCEV